MPGMRGGPGPGMRGGPGRFMLPGEKPKETRVILARLWAEVRGREQGLMVLVLCLVTVTSGVALLAPFLIGRAIDTMAGGADGVAFTPLFAIVGTLIAAHLIDAGVVLFQGWTMAGISQRIVASIRGALFAKLQKLPVAFFDQHNHGDLMSRLANDVDNISVSLSQMTAQMMASILGILGSLAMMIILDPLLTLATMITLPLMFLLTRTIARRTRRLFRAQQDALGGLNGHIEETVSGVTVVKAFERERQVTAGFDGLNQQLRQSATRAMIWAGFLMPVMNVISNLGFVAIAAVGGVLAASGRITVGIIASFLSYSRQFTRPLNEVANIYNTLQTALAGAERVFEIIDEAEEAADPPHAVPLESPRGEVTFDQVSFAYVPEVTVLHGVSFTAPPGSATALVGPTGAGKTTIVNLLARFYDVSSGRILIDGRDIRDYTRDSLQRCFGVVLQDTYLFAGSIRDNIAYGNPTATDAEIRASAEAANADHFIRRFPDGYDTRLTESGSNLSQGQRQLIAIARAVLSDPTILILDEATSNVDTRTELRIQEAMLALTRDRTSFIIAHRLSTIRDADRILVVDDGTIIEEGTHTTLAAHPGVYRDMYESQTRDITV